MSSILTNEHAMSAISIFRNTNNDLKSVQERISSGLRVADAADNAAYWSIATIMRSDSEALSAVSDAIGLGASKINVAKDSMNDAIKVLTDIKSKLVAATEDGTDTVSVQEEINQLQDQLHSIAEGASFNGENWLKASLGSPSASISKSVVSSFVREENGAISIKNIEYKLNTGSVLFDTTSSVDKKNYGILDSKYTMSNLEQKMAKIDVQYVDTDDGKLHTKTFDLATASAAWLKGQGASFDAKNGISTIAAGTSGGSGAPGTPVAAATYIRVKDDVWVKASETELTVKDSAGAKEIGKVSVFTDAGAKSYYIDIGNKAVSKEKSQDVEMDYSVVSLDITKADSDGMYTKSGGIKNMVKFVNNQLQAMTAAAGKLGSIHSRIKLQEDFIHTLQDSIKKGIGRLVDADMEAESSRLAALQTQQQLALQSLSMANSNSQRLLMLFK
ncbi:Flagellin protein FlaA [Liberibacter crescens BT-1]|uniref:Flagellin n=1 Tax=Liberibacter crescens (strain BT-1) TaxID=1215343 RepID=L0EVR1_LIBCB|nr:flagellin [Liberibacter crescens]AGA64945.1 Flagellin protein FlaA [Liberibacter crescens BT-1]AMC12966.1 hypothetical protein RL73_04800 [Liberibacter crescens]